MQSVCSVYVFGGVIVGDPLLLYVAVACAFLLLLFLAFLCVCVCLWRVCARVS